MLFWGASGEKEMKERLSFTLDKESVKTLEELLHGLKYRNRSHIVEVALKALFEQEKEAKTERKRKA